MKNSMIPKLNARPRTRDGLSKKETYDIFRTYDKGRYHPGDLRGYIKELAYRTFFLSKDEIRLVAYSERNKRAVGSIGARKITERLWGAWDIFVSPAYRGKRIGTLLLRETVQHLKRKKVEKLISYVNKNNISSIKHSRRTGWKLLRNRIFKCSRIDPLVEPYPEKIKVRKLRHGEKRRLFDIFELCVKKQWCRFLEINQENYLNRIYGPAFWEEYGILARAVLSKVATKKRIMVAEIGRELRGYIITLTRRLLGTDCVTFLFVPISKDFDPICKSLLLKAFGPSSYKAKKEFIYIGNDESREHIKELGFEFQEFLVQGLQL